MENNESTKPQWETVKKITQEGVDLEVTINKLALFRPIYSMHIGGTEGKKYLRVFAKGQGKVEVTPVNLEQLCIMVREAEEWIRQDRQKREDEIIAFQQKREEKFDRGKKEEKRTGKTEKNRNKHREERP